MHKKSFTTLSIAVFIVIAIASVLFLTRKPDTLAVRIQMIEEESEQYSIHAEYPQFSNFPDSFNEKIRQGVLDRIDQFKSESADTFETRALYGGPVDYQATFSAGWTPEQMTREMVSFIMRFDLYTGGAHGRQDMVTFTFDGQQEQEVTLEAVFTGVPNYLERISQFVRIDLQAQMERAGGVPPNMDMLRSGTTAESANFKHFTVSAADTITFYFPQYQVAPYAYGEQKVIMPLSYLRAESGD